MQHSPEHSAVVEALRRPEAYVHEGFRPAGIGAVETHVSHLFLTGELVYKVKKPVALGFVGFTPLERRKANCERELVAASALRDICESLVYLRTLASGG